MSFLSRARLALARAIAPRPAPALSRAFAAAQVGRLTSDWIAAATSADAEIRRDYRRLIDRARSLERDNDYMRGFLLSCQRNINGSHRYDLRSDAGEFVPGKSADGQTVRKWKPDLLAKSLIEEAWIEWGKKGVCTLDRRTTWRGVRRLAVRSAVRDGNVLLRKVRGPAAGNRFGFALQLWEIDHLDLEKFQERTREGNEIRFGIEFDADGAPVAYWVRARHPGDFVGGGYQSSRSVRLPAGEFYHLCLPDRAEQTVGYPWIVAAVARLRQLGAFEEAAVIAARLGASNAVMFETTGEDEWAGDRDDSGRAIMDIEPGVATQLPKGWKPHGTEFAYPNIETGEFRKAMLRGVATGLGASYTSIGNDLESVNFSSARVGLFDEREGWKELQLFFSEELWEPIFADWLEAAIAAGALALPMGKFAKFNRPVFKARRWAMIDPAKEMEARKAAIALRLGSRRGFIEEDGGDVEEVFHDNLADEQLAEDIGLTLSPPDPEPEAFGEVLPAGEGDTPADSAPGQKPKPKPKPAA